MILLINLLLYLLITFLLFYLCATFDLFFTFVKEGQAKVIMKGESVARYIANIAGYAIDETTGEIYKNPSNQRNHRNILEEWFGLYLVGLPPFRKVYNYKFKWGKYAPSQELQEAQITIPMTPVQGASNSYEIMMRSEVVNSVYFRYPYAVKVLEVENKDRIPLNILVVFTTEIENVEKALFKSGGQWLTNVTAAVEAIIVEFVGSKSLQDLTEAQHESGASGLIEKILSINEDTPSGNQGITNLFGVKILTANFIGYEIVGEIRNRILEASNAEYFATQTAKAKVIETDASVYTTKEQAKANADAKKSEGFAEAEVIEKKGLAEATATERRFKAKSGVANGDKIALAEAIENTGAKTLVFGGPQPLPTVPLTPD